MKRLFACAFMILMAGVPAFAGQRTAVFAGGCFWCVEKDFEGVPGVIEATSGYIGGSKADASYRKVTQGGTGHYEAVQILYDDSRISYAELVHLFFRSVDPVDEGGQFCDRGTSYRTAIFTANRSEAAVAKAAKQKAGKELGQKIVTPILPATPFYVAEDYHQDYYKSTEKTLTRFGLITRAKAYSRYRTACGRDARVKQLWGSTWTSAGS
ncbi:MAG: peptide-methionine (S)-S-oxide reductase MsrA [Rhodobacteraceae bacterium]|nr:peptide-methionine (S)-S-oxide reductase MsrA [Paracoccaceae bacterium]